MQIVASETTLPDLNVSRDAKWSNDTTLYPMWKAGFPRTQDGLPLLELINTIYAIAADNIQVPFLMKE